MGLGKTLTLISLILKQRAEGKVSSRGDSSDTQRSSWLSTGQKGTHLVITGSGLEQVNHRVARCLVLTRQSGFRRSVRSKI